MTKLSKSRRSPDFPSMQRSCRYRFILTAGPQFRLPLKLAENYGLNMRAESYWRAKHLDLNDIVQLTLQLLERRHRVCGPYLKEGQIIDGSEGRCTTSKPCSQG